MPLKIVINNEKLFQNFVKAEHLLYEHMEIHDSKPTPKTIQKLRCIIYLCRQHLRKTLQQIKIVELERIINAN